MNWETGQVSKPEEDKDSKTIKFLVIKKIIPPGSKSLSEARGYVVADYQDYLERQWIDTLKQTYKVDIDQAVFKNLIKE